MKIIKLNDLFYFQTLFFFNYYYFFKKNYFKIYIIYSLLIFFLLYTLNIFNDDYKWLDSLEYIKRAEQISFFPLNLESLEDAFRPPLYPIILKFINFIPFNLLIMGKFLNFFLLTSMPFVLFKISQKINSQFYKKTFFININLLLFFYPNFYFVDLIYAEVLTIFFFNIYIFQLIKVCHNYKYVNLKSTVIISTIFLILFYLKANMLLVSLTFLIILFSKVRNKILFFFRLCFISGIMLLPWFYYTFNLTGEIKATTSQHVNRLIGMGHDVIYGNNLDTIHGRFLINAYKNNSEIINSFKMYRNKLDEKKILKTNFGISKDFQLMREKYSKESIDHIWNYDKTIQIKYSILKIPHLFGLNLRNVKDYLFLIFFTTVFIAHFCIRKLRSANTIIIFNYLIFLTLIVQTLIYNPTLRYSIYFANSSLLILSAMITLLFLKNRKH